MNNFWVTVAHTAGKRIRTKAFIWSTAVIAVLIIGLMNITTVIDMFGGEDGETEKSTIAVVYDTTTADVAELLSSYEEGEFSYVAYPDSDLAAAKQATEEGEFTYVLGLTGDPSQIEAEFFSEGTDFTVGETVRMDVQRMKETIVTNELGLNEEELAMIYNPIVFNERALTNEGNIETEESHMQSYFMVYGLVFVIYMVILLFGSMIATEVATEKSSRVMELIISSVNPITQMFGKIIGIGLAGVLNMAMLVLAAYVGYLISGETYLETILQDMLEGSLLGYALILIVLGYLLYGGVAAMLGALVSRAEEVNQAIQPLVFVAMIALFISITGLNVPDATFIKVLSYVPFFTPQLLFLRIGMTSVPTWEIIVILTVLVLSVIVMNLLAARIYKGGVLMYGKFSFKNGIKQALRLGKRER
ncbi:ABC transporter permease [Bacillus suaedae]|uniref:ABC transporter permease n=1 Tax=Halalkalibacter suaedae TaxID=2822140 RepID=A0A940WRA3_9BACI|nr:ABC transporter permease [Bacillus suaedae]MBP3950881.1 ABC transporter permease [Bacillus suaedae]